MKQLCFKISTISFHLFCITWAIFWAKHAFIEYRKNHNSLHVHYNRFQKNNSSTYPSVSMCFSTPFKSNELENHEKGITPFQYSNFIMGITNYSESLAKIRFEDVILQLDDFLISATISSKNIGLDEEELPINSNITSVNLSVYVWRFLKCFSFNIPYDEGVIINKLLITINRNIFPNKRRPMDGWAKYFGISMYYHLPNQLLKSYSTRKIMWPRETLRSYSSVIYISNIEILIRRRKTPTSCTSIMNYDKWIIEEIISSVGCFPPYWNTSMRLPACNATKQLRQISNTFWDRFYGNAARIPPCITMQHIDLEYLDSEPWEGDNENHLYFPIFFRDKSYKEIKQARQYELRDLLGDVGGVNGFLLGYSLVQVPNFIWAACMFLKSMKRRIVSKAFSLKKPFVNWVEDIKDVAVRSNICVVNCKEDDGKSNNEEGSTYNTNVIKVQSTSNMEPILQKLSGFANLALELEEKLKIQEREFENMKKELEGFKANFRCMNN